MPAIYPAAFLLGNGNSLADSSRTLATLAVEKVLDGLALVGMVLFSVWALRPPHWVLDLLRAATLIFAGALGLLIILRYKTRLLIRYVRSAFHFMHLSFLQEKLDRVLTSFAEGLNAVSSAPQMLMLLALTSVIWTTEAGLIWGLAGALGLSVSLKSAVVASAVLGLGLISSPPPRSRACSLGGVEPCEEGRERGVDLGGVGQRALLADLREQVRVVGAEERHSSPSKRRTSVTGRSSR